MIPKTIHLCWFSGDKYPLEVRACMKTWAKWLPDYKVRMWTYEDAKAINCPFINEALERRKWAFAADAVRYYAVWKEGGVYMDSDIWLFSDFSHIIPEHGCATVNECVVDHGERAGLQAAFFMGEKGNEFCKTMFEYYKNRHFIKPDGTTDETVAPYVMADVAKQFGFKNIDEKQELDGLTIYPTRYLAPLNHYPRTADTFGMHRILGSWIDYPLGKKFLLKYKHYWHIVKYAVLGRY